MHGRHRTLGAATAACRHSCGTWWLLLLLSSTEAERKDEGREVQTTATVRWSLTPCLCLRVGVLQCGRRAFMTDRICHICTELPEREDAHVLGVRVRAVGVVVAFQSRELPAKPGRRTHRDSTFQPWIVSS